MVKFMVRVVLHEATTAPEAYDELNTAMALRGFGRELPGRKASYHLPAGNYWYEGNGKLPSDVRDLAAAAAESTNQDFGIAVVRANGWSVMRLKKARAASQG